MNTESIVLIIVGAGVLTAAVAHLVFRLMHVEVRRRHLEVGTAIFLQLGVIYAVFLAFVFGQALTSFVAADNSIDTECAALHGAAMIAGALPPPARQKLSRAFDTYISSVLDSEWEAMRTTRRASPEAAANDVALIDTANTLDVTDAKTIRIQTQVVAALLDAHRSREERLFEAGQGIPTGLWVMILVYCGCLIALVFFSSLEYALSHAMVAGMFGALNALTLLAVVLLQYPFEGPFRLSPATFALTQARIDTTLGR